MYSRKMDVESMNLVELEKLEGDNICYECQDTIAVKTKNNGKPTISRDDLNTTEYMEIMDGIVSPELLMKPGAQVMLKINLDVESGLTNGSRGVVEECQDEHIVVKFVSGLIMNITPNAYEFEDDKVIMVRYQFPLILAWALTVHSSQGSTLDKSIIDVGSSLFSPGMGYVALSRCKTLDGIYIINVMEKMIRPNLEALKFENYLIENSVIAPSSIHKKDDCIDAVENEEPGSEISEDGRSGDK